MFNICILINVVIHIRSAFIFFNTSIVTIKLIFFQLYLTHVGFKSKYIIFSVHNIKNNHNCINNK